MYKAGKTSLFRKHTRVCVQKLNVSALRVRAQPPSEAASVNEIKLWEAKNVYSLKRVS